jgi:hypothetical protein
MSLKKKSELRSLLFENMTASDMINFLPEGTHE